MGLFSKRKNKKLDAQSVFVQSEQADLLASEVVEGVADDESAVACAVASLGAVAVPIDTKVAPQDMQIFELAKTKSKSNSDVKFETTCEIDDASNNKKQPQLEIAKTDDNSNVTNAEENFENVPTAQTDLEPVFEETKYSNVPSEDNKSVDTIDIQETPIKKAKTSTAKTGTASSSAKISASVQQSLSQKESTLGDEDGKSETAVANNGKFIIKKLADGNFDFVLLAPNHETIATGEPYTSLTACKTGIASIQKIVETAEIEDQTLQKPIARTNPKWEIYYDDEKAFRFRLYARNGEVVAISNAYKAKASCKNGIKSICTNAPLAEIIREDDKD